MTFFWDSGLILVGIAKTGYRLNKSGQGHSLVKASGPRPSPEVLLLRVQGLPTSRLLCPALVPEARTGLPALPSSLQPSLHIQKQARQTARQLEALVPAPFKNPETILSGCSTASLDLRP